VESVDRSALGASFDAASPNHRRCLLEAGVIILTLLSLYYPNLSNYAAPHYLLSQAYRKLGRSIEAAQEQEAFLRVKRIYGNE
jgi:hypothetical protein